MPNSVIILKPVADAPVDSTLLELTLRATDATPENIILYPRPSLAAAGLVVITLAAMGLTDSWPTVNQVTGGIEWLQDGVKFIGALSAGAAVYPAVSDVDLGVAYGPGGSDYAGTLKQPAVSDVLTGVQYGAGGTEFTGTASGGGGVPGLLLDLDSGDFYEGLTDSVIYKV